MENDERKKVLLMEEGFNLIYVKKGSIPKSIFFNDKKEVIAFLVEELDNIDYITINDRQLNINEFLNGSKKLSRIIKLNKI